LKVPIHIKEWNEIHKHFLSKQTRDLFDTELIDYTQDTSFSLNYNSHLTYKLDKKCMQGIPLLDGKKILSLFDTGSTVNLISEDIVKDSPYLSSLPKYFVHK